MENIHPCYRDKILIHRWQGDLYKASDFKEHPIRISPYWMLLNRTCHLVEGMQGRIIKLPFLVFCLVQPLREFLAPGKFIMPGKKQASHRNQISNLIHNKIESASFLPASEQHGIIEPLVASFNQIWTFNLEDCPEAKQKIAQLSSPFTEHIIQRFSRWFYTVGYDDSEFKSENYIDSVVNSIALRKAK